MKLQGIDNDAYLGALCWRRIPSIEVLNRRGKSAAGGQRCHGMNVAQLHDVESQTGSEGQ